MLIDGWCWLNWRENPYSRRKWLTGSIPALDSFEHAIKGVFLWDYHVCSKNHLTYHSLNKRIDFFTFAAIAWVMGAHIHTILTRAFSFSGKILIARCLDQKWVKTFCCGLPHFLRRGSHLKSGRITLVLLFFLSARFRSHFMHESLFNFGLCMYFFFCLRPVF